MIIMERYTDKVALITGGGGEMARAITQRLLSEGSFVVLFDISQKLLDETVADLEKRGTDISRIKTITGDVRSYEDNERAAAFSVNTFGKIDVLVTTAGIIRHSSIDEMTEQSWKDVIDINLTGTFYSVKAAVPSMKEQRYGRIVMISSLAGRTGRPGVGVNYAASKAGIIGMTMLLGYELGPHNITVNAVAPGPIKGCMTDSDPELMTRLRAGTRIQRLGEMTEIAAAVAYLGSDDASWTTGEVLDVNGGLQY